jgi:glycerol-3-phosphate acyltransferase PlsX
VLASSAWKKLGQRADPRRYNGGVFLGLNGVCVKSHGGTDELGFAYALGVAVDLVKYHFSDKVVEDIGRLRRALDDAPTAAAAGEAAGAA